MISYEICLSLTYFTKHNTFQVHPCCCKWQNFILFMAEYYSIVYILHLLYSSVDGHLGCLHILAIINNAAMILGCIYLFKLMFLFSSNIYPGVELLDHMVFPFVVFWGTSILFSTVPAPIYIPTMVYNVSLFSTSLPTFVVCGLFDDRHSDKCEGVSRGFDLHFPDD